MNNIRPLPPALALKALAELNEFPERIESELSSLKEWISKTPHLKARTDDQFLMAFLRGCKHSLEKAKAKIDMFYTIRSSLPDLMLDRDPLDSKILEIIRLGVGLPLPLTETQDSPRILLIRPGAYDSNQFNIHDILKVANMINDILMLEDDNFAVVGNIAIVDFQNVTKGHLVQLNPVLVKKLAMMNQEASPFRQRGFHFTNTPPGFDVVFNLFKSVMTDKNCNRMKEENMEVFIHGDSYDTIHDHISQKVLPSEYGGEAGPIQDIITYWEQKLISYRSFFLEDGNYGTVERLRVNKLQHSDIVFGVDGSFKKLDID